MKKNQLIALLLTLTMLLTMLSACGKSEKKEPEKTEVVYGPVYDEWSEMTDEEL